MPGGAPRKYDRKQVFLEILFHMSKGDRCLEKILEDEPDKFPCPQDYWDWQRADTDEARELSDISLRAQELWCRAQTRKMMEISDDDSKDVMEVEESFIKDNGEVVRRIRKTSDNTAVNRARLRVQARQWAMAKLAPKVFGDKQQLEHTGKDGGAFSIQVNITGKNKDS